jgi:hypothetical protein
MSKEHESLIVKVIDPFTCNVNGSIRSFTIGQVERDYITAKFLIDSGCPVKIIDKEEAMQLRKYQCPKCMHIYEG